MIKQKTVDGWKTLVSFSGGGGTPEEYLKTASVSDNTLTLTKQDDTTVEFSAKEIQYQVLPIASAGNVDEIVEYVGETDSNYTNGYFYKNVHESIAESITAEETDNLGLLDGISVNATTFKSKVNGGGTYVFVKKGYPTKATFMNITAFPPTTYSITRDTIFDNTTLGIYSWVDSSNNYYVTNTLRLNAGTKLYSYDINTDETTDTGASYLSSSEPSTTSGYWTIQTSANVYDDANLEEYGITMSTNGFPGNEITVTYIEANDTYTWTRIDVQPAGSGGTGDYTQLTNKPKINNVELVGNKSLSDLGINIPTVNDATLTIQKNGTDVATFTANSSTNTTANISVPTDTNDLTNGAGYITNEYHDSTKQDVITSENKLSYNLLSDTPTIPSKTSDLTNDSGFVDTDVDNLKNYTKSVNLGTLASKDTVDYETEVTNTPDLTVYSLITETGNKIDLSIDSSTYIMTLILKDKNDNTLSTGTVDLPLETMVVDGRYDSATKKIILTLKNGTTIEFSVADLVSGLQTEITTTNKLSSDLVDDTDKTNKFMSQEEKTKLAGLNNYDDTEVRNLINEKYTKPTDGIPKNDLESSVQTSLGLADTALQSYTESDPIFTASPANGITTTDITNWNGKSVVTVNKKVEEGTNIADITINGTTTELYAPANSGATWGSITGTLSSQTDLNTELNNKQDILQFETMPTASSAYENKIVQYIGMGASEYIMGYFYICVSDGAETPNYNWETVRVQSETTDIEWGHIFGALDSQTDLSNELSNKQNTMQYQTLPTASGEIVGKVIQYTGTTTADYTNGYFYKCVSDEQETPTYSWEQLDVQVSSNYTAGDNIDIKDGTISSNPNVPLLILSSTDILNNAEATRARVSELLTNAMNNSKKVIYIYTVEDQWAVDHYVNGVTCYIVESKKTFYTGKFMSLIPYSFAGSVHTGMIQGSWDGNTFTCSDITAGNVNQNRVLTTNNTSSFIPTGDYEPAVKKYVDDNKSINESSIAPAYSSSSTYSIDDYVVYNHDLYVCNTEISTAEEWTAEHWTATNLVSLLSR